MDNYCATCARLPLSPGPLLFRQFRRKSHAAVEISSTRARANSATSSDVYALSFHFNPCSQSTVRVLNSGHLSNFVNKRKRSRLFPSLQDGNKRVTVVPILSQLLHVGVPKDFLKMVVKDMNLSDQEIQKFEKAFQDPEFIRMFSDYAKEMQDPANRAETDAYLRQLEQQGDIESTYGKGTQLIIPEPQFCFKTKARPCGTKVFVNVCSSDKVRSHCLTAVIHFSQSCAGLEQQPSQQVAKSSVKPSRNAQGCAGQQWELPLAGSNCKRVTTDKKGNTAWVWDITLHTETFVMLAKQPRLLNLIVESAIEHVESTNKLQLDRKFSRPKLKFKGTAENPDKPAVTVRSLHATV
jgi:hypothetical protein